MVRPRMYEGGAIPAAMKWWGWGEEEVSFTHEGKPELAPFIERCLGLDVRRPGTSAIAFEDLKIPAATLPAGLRAELEDAVGAEHVSTDDLDRVVHGRGKRLTDLIRQRRGDLGRLPDVVVRPAAEDQVAAVVRAALEDDAVVIPFGGGSSISGSLEAEPEETRPVISLDISRLNRVLSVDATSQLARVQAGVFGPDLERQLGAQGWTSGHFPDSFTYSTLGGWIATRSSGMQSDRYGDIAELTRGLRVVTPSGILAVRPVPSTSTGPSVGSSATCSPPGRPAWPPCATSPRVRPRRRSRVCRTPPRPRSRSPRATPLRRWTASSRGRFGPSSNAGDGTWRRCACRSSATRAAPTTRPLSAS